VFRSRALITVFTSNAIILVTTITDIMNLIIRVYCEANSHSVT